jgi:hypothetical protein
VPQVTLYLDEDTADQMRRAAKAKGVSQSRWLAELVRQASAREWPAAVRELAGAWKDFPTADELRQRVGRDAKREKL